MPAIKGVSSQVMDEINPGFQRDSLIFSFFFLFSGSCLRLAREKPTARSEGSYASPTRAAFGCGLW